MVVGRGSHFFARLFALSASVAKFWVIFWSLIPVDRSVIGMLGEYAASPSSSVIASDASSFACFRRLSSSLSTGLVMTISVRFILSAAIARLGRLGFALFR